MRRILLILLLLFSAAVELPAQELKVKIFELRDRDLKAKQKPRFDNNEDACALVRVQVAAPNCVFSDSYIVGDVEQGFGEYLVYMAKGARRLRIAHPDFLFTPLDYEFPEALESYRTYALILEVPIYTHYAEIVEQQSQQQPAKPTQQSQPIVRQTAQTQPLGSFPSTTTLARRPGTWQVGDYYNVNGKEGVVFWVDETGKHGKIVSMTESGYLLWTSDKNEQRRLIGADNETDGAKNMAVVKQIPDWQSKYPAFKWCADLGEGWYLPAKEELKLFTLDTTVLDKVNRTLAQHGGKRLAEKGADFWYWSSTESSYKNNRTFCAWVVHLGNGHTDNALKNIGSYERAVSAF